MKIGIALLIAGVAFGATSVRSQDFDFGDASQEGIVESIREVPIPRDMHSFDPEVLEHPVRPASAEEAVIRLDGGELITIHHTTSLRKGQRVRVVLTGSQAHVERLDP
ncbi:MAG TPA: hypothetical protein VJT77_08145 [Burkholderiales bacterium]|nr:hypothetical protein [Burkholderiales bacterium]